MPRDKRIRLPFDNIQRPRASFSAVSAPTMWQIRFANIFVVSGCSFVEGVKIVLEAAHIAQIRGNDAPHISPLFGNLSSLIPSITANYAFDRKTFVF
jgi:hypothetical protein